MQNQDDDNHGKFLFFCQMSSLDILIKYFFINKKACFYKNENQHNLSTNIHPQLSTAYFYAMQMSRLYYIDFLLTSFVFLFFFKKVLNY